MTSHSPRREWTEAIQKVSGDLDKKQRSQVSKAEVKTDSTGAASLLPAGVLKVPSLPHTLTPSLPHSSHPHSLTASDNGRL